MKSKSTFVPLPADYLRSLPSPTLGKRVALNLYELLVLIGVAAFAFLLPHLLIGVFFSVTAPSWFLLAHLYLLLALYFSWYWTRTGQTLAMQTWRIQLIDLNGHIIARSQALMRYAIASLWLIPASIALYIASRVWGMSSMGTSLSIVFFFTTLFFWPLTILFNLKERQAWVDRWSKTRLVQLPRVITHPVSGREK